MKKVILLSTTCLIVLVFLLNGCGGGKYADAIKLNQQYVSLTKTYIADLDKVNNAKDTAKAMNKYADGLEKLWPQMKKVSEKYPEMRDKNNPPEEMKASQKETESMGMKMGSTFQKIMPYMRDPDVQKAQQRISSIMQK